VALRSIGSIFAAWGLILCSSVAAPATGPTYFKDIAPILQDNCVQCHRPGQIAPMPLLTFDQVRPWAAAIREAVLLRTMPPWPAQASRGHFAGDRRLTDQQISTIRTWTETGAPRGDPRQAPPAHSFSNGWQFGHPNMILRMPHAQTIPGTKSEVWKYIYFDQPFEEDTWIRAVEIRPGNYKLVHHANVQVITPTGDHLVDWKSVEPEVDAPQNDPPPLAGVDMVQIHIGLPGQFSLETQPGSAILIPKRSRIRLNIHYAPSATPETDNTAVGLYFASGRIDKRWRLHYTSAEESAIRIPARDSRYELRAIAKLSEPMTVLEVGCHMHIRGMTYRVDAELPGGQTIELLNVPRFNFHWQFLYRLADPIHLPAGTVLHDVATFDNSAANPLVTTYDTPDREVTYGNRTVDEMMTSYILHTLDSEKLGLFIDGRTGLVSAIEPSARKQTVDSPIDDLPQLLRSVETVNLVKFRGRIYGVPQSLGPLGPVDWQKGNVDTMPGVVIGATVQDVIRQLPH
jgi:mono/diheme cytochrome c family protein